MAVTQLHSNVVSPVIAARSTASTAPTGATDGYLCGSDGGQIRSLVTYAGAVTAAVIRLWVRNRTSGVWYRGASSTDIGALTPASGNDSRDWIIGEGAEFTFQLESISQTGGGTVAVDVVGVEG